MGLASFQDANPEPQEAVFQLLGCTYRTLAEPQAFFVWWSLLNPGKGDGYLETGKELLASFPHETQQFHAHWMDPMSETNSESNHHGHHDLPNDHHDLPKYTSLLFEKGQESGQAPQRTVSTISIDPPRFEVTILFGTCHGTGIGRTKKVAGHLAAKQVCHQLNIGI